MTMPTRASLVALLATVCFPSAALADPTGDWLNAQRISWNVPGVTVAVVRAGQAPRVYASGDCTLAPRRPCTGSSPFHIGSISKFFTGLTAASLAADKTVRLDDPVLAVWPQFRLADARYTEVTLRDLLGGRTGIGSIDWPYFWDPALTRSDYVARLAHVPLVKPFRANWFYANANFVAAGVALEHATGQSWETLVRERLFAPLAMGACGFAMPAGATTGYALDGANKDVAMAPTSTAAIGPAGSIVSSAEDLSHWLAMLADDGKWNGRQAFPANALAMASAPVIGVGHDRRYYGAPSAYAMGAFLATYRQRPIVHHGGGYAGYTAHFAWLPHQRSAVFVLTNRNATDFAEAMALALLDRESGDDGDATMEKWRAARETAPPPPAPDKSAPPTRPLDAYAGRYQHPAWGTFTIARDGDRLALSTGGLRTLLDHARFDSFSFPAELGWERLRLRFEADFDGRIDALLLDDGVHPQPQRFSRAAK